MSIFIVRKQDETFPEFQFRLYENREEYGLSNLEIATILNKEIGTNYDESKFRKEYQIYKNVWEKLVEKKQNSYLPDDYLKEIDDKLLNFEKEKIKFLDQKRLMKAELRKLARLENLEEHAKNCIEAIEPVSLPIIDKQTELKEAMVVISDAHIGMEIDTQFNKYNHDIAKSRLTELKQKTFEKVKKEKISKLYIVSNGDQFEGHIHVTARIEQEINVIEQITTFTSYLQDFIQDFLDLGIEVELLVVAGNHTRLMPNKNESLGTNENFERLIRVILDKVFSKYPNYASRDDENGILITKIGNEVIALEHGDLVKSATPIARLKDLTHEDISILVTGHLHNFFIKEYGNSLHIGVGCLGGINNFAINGRFSGRPSQMILTFNSKGLEEIVPVYFQ